MHIYILCFKTFEELIGFFLYFSIYIYIIHNQISIYVNRRSNKRHRMSNISMILRVHIHGDALIPHTHTHTHTYKYYADRPRDPMSVPKAVLSLGLFLLLGGEPCGNVPCEEASGWELGMSQSLAKWNGHYILRSISWCTVNVFGVSRM